MELPGHPGGRQRQRAKRGRAGCRAGWLARASAPAAGTAVRRGFQQAVKAWKVRSAVGAICFSMALSQKLGEHEVEPERLDARAPHHRPRHRDLHGRSEGYRSVGRGSAGDSGGRAPTPHRPSAQRSPASGQDAPELRVGRPFVPGGYRGSSTRETMRVSAYSLHLRVTDGPSVLRGRSSPSPTQRMCYDHTHVPHPCAHRCRGTRGVQGAG